MSPPAPVGPPMEMEITMTNLNDDLNDDLDDLIGAPVTRPAAAAS